MGVPDKTVPYYLRMQTDSYAGNFSRELIAYAFGVLDSAQTEIDYASAYIKAFWNCEAKVGSLEDYERCMERNSEAWALSECARSVLDAEGDMSGEELLELLQKKESEVKNKKDGRDLRRISEEYLMYTEKEDTRTFYSIGGHGGTCIYVQLNKPLDEYFENLIVRRIKGWFENDVYAVFEKFSRIMMFGELSGEIESPCLVSLDLVNDGDEVQKSY